jgi:ABC-2 type transport system ATP-binding protein
MITATRLTKRYGDTTAVDGVSFAIRPGIVTGFLGPNGAGKSTTMRMILGLDAPTSGTVTVAGRPYRALSAPLHSLGALLDAGAVDGGRTAANHLLWLAQSNDIDRRRVGEVLDVVGLSDVARRRVATFSLGMKQRLGIAAALLGDPPVLMFDEPINGLDPDGILWIRKLMRSLASEGRTVFLSSHLMSEMEHTADHLLVIGRGKIIADASIDDVIRNHARSAVRVKAVALQEELTRLLVARGAQIEAGSEGALIVSGLDASAIGGLAALNAVALAELTPQEASLEDAFLNLTHHDVEFRAAARQGA